LAPICNEKSSAKASQPVCGYRGSAAGSSAGPLPAGLSNTIQRRHQPHFFVAGLGLPKLDLQLTKKAKQTLKIAFDLGYLRVLLVNPFAQRRYVLSQ
jgi:hypothetical protein